MFGTAMSLRAPASSPPGRSPWRTSRHLALVSLSLGLLGPALSARADTAALSGTLTLCAAGCDYASLTNAGGLFEAINAAGLSGDLVIDVTSDLDGELGTHALEEWVEEGDGGYTLLIRPSGGARTISGSLSGALIRLHGADRVTIDGSTAATLAPGAGGDPAPRELTLQNTSAGTAAVVVAVQSFAIDGVGTNGAQNNTLRNLVVLGQDSATTYAGIAMGGETPGTAGLDNDGNRVENCAVRRALFGIYSAAASAGDPNIGTVLTRNDLAGTGADRLRRGGMIVFHEDGIQITENLVGGLSSDGFYDVLGIGIGTQIVDLNSVASEGPVTNALVARNRIDGVVSTADLGFSAAGIVIAGGAGGANTLANNMVSGVVAPANTANLVAGIHVLGIAGSTTRIYHNTVALAGERGAVPAAQGPSYALSVTGVDPALVLRNNVLANTQTSGGGAGAESYAIGLATAVFDGLDSDGNDFFVAGANAGGFRTGSLGPAAGTDHATLAAWSAAVGDDGASLEVDPLLVSAADLHLQAASPLLGAGLPLPAVSDDFDGEPRPATAPDIGADEVVTPQADLSISKDDGVDAVVAGRSTLYSIVVTNAGPDAEPAALVADAFPAACATVTWTCSATGGGTCAASGTGDIADSAALPAGASVTYTAECAVPEGTLGTLANTATVTGSLPDPDASDNSATDVDELLGPDIFADDFETGDLSRWSLMVPGEAPARARR